MRSFIKGHSTLANQISVLETEREEKILKIKTEYLDKIEQLKQKCTHKYDNGVVATHEERWGYNDYHEICEICGKDLTA